MPVVIAWIKTDTESSITNIVSSPVKSGLIKLATFKSPICWGSLLTSIIFLAGFNESIYF